MEGVKVLREQTTQFIADNPMEIVLKRNVPLPDGAGGTRIGPATDLRPQVVRLIPPNSGVPVELTTVSGEVERPDYTLLGEYDLDIQTDDWFFIETGRHEVTWVHFDKTFKTVASVVRRG